MIRDRVVCGVNDNRIQCRLLQESELTYKQAFDIAQAMEVASKDIQDLLRPLPIRLFNVYITKNLNLPVTDVVVAIHLILVVFVLSNVIRVARKVTPPKFAVANPPVVIKTPQSLRTLKYIQLQVSKPQHLKRTIIFTRPIKQTQ